MTERDYKIRAAGHFLCDHLTNTMEQQLEILENTEIPHRTADYIDGVITWEVFEYLRVDELLEYISILARDFEECHKSGEFDGYEKIKDLIEKQYEAK